MKIANLFRSATDATKQTQVEERADIKREQLKNSQIAQTPANDTVTISTAARSFAAVGEVLAQDDEIREAKIADLKSRIDDGSYAVSSEDVAKSVISFVADANF